MTLGIMLCGLGLALAMLIAFAGGAFAVGTGVGGAFVMVGLAFIVAAMSTRPGADRAPETPRTGAGAMVPPPPDGPRTP
jgi:hypothetical protein